MLELVRPSIDYEKSCLEAISEFQTEHFREEASNWYYNVGKDFGDFVNDLLARGTLRTDRIVPESIYWGVIGDIFVGRISIRHELTEHLLRVGGHIGYEVRPSYRRQGVASKMLELILPEAKKLKLDRVLLTCDETNSPSIKVIEKHGGILENSISQGDGKPAKLRYWITL